MKLTNILNFQFNQDGELHENKLNTLNYDKNMITSYIHVGQSLLVVSYSGQLTQYLVLDAICTLS